MVTPEIPPQTVRLRNRDGDPVWVVISGTVKDGLFIDLSMPPAVAHDPETRWWVDDPEIRKLIDSPHARKGRRSNTILAVMYACAEEGWTNHEILILARELAERWEKYPAANAHRQWTKLLSMLATVRRKYPVPESPPPGPRRRHAVPGASGK